METTSNISVLASEPKKDNEHQAPNLLSQKGQPVLRLILNPEAPLDEPPRRYSQSTSGRVSATGTAPALSRSSDIDRDSRMRSPVESALRKYPTEVSQRTANASCSDVSREFRYTRRDSIAGTLPTGNDKSIPVGHLPFGNDRYAAEMRRKSKQELFKIRRSRLADLLDEFGGPQKKQVVLAGEIASRAAVRVLPGESIKSLATPSYISNALGARKNIGEESASILEALFGKPAGWMSSRKEEPLSDDGGWPFRFSRELWESLSKEHKEKAEEQLLIYVKGLKSLATDELAPQGKQWKVGT